MVRLLRCTNSKCRRKHCMDLNVEQWLPKLRVSNYHKIVLMINGQPGFCQTVQRFFCSKTYQQPHILKIQFDCKKLTTRFLIARKQQLQQLLLCVKIHTRFRSPLIWIGVLQIYLGASTACLTTHIIDERNSKLCQKIFQITLKHVPKRVWKV